MTDILPIFVAGTHNNVQAGDLVEENGHILIVITNRVLEDELRDCLEQNRQPNLQFTNIETEETIPAEPPGFWVACYGDMSRVVIFLEEIDCLRYAVNNHTLVFWVPEGTSIQDAMNRKDFAQKEVTGS